MPRDALDGALLQAGKRRFVALRARLTRGAGCYIPRPPDEAVQKVP